MRDGIRTLIAVVVLLLLIGELAPVVLTSLFNTTAYTGVPTFVAFILGILGVVAFIFIILDAADKH